MCDLHPLDGVRFIGQVAHLSADAGTNTVPVVVGADDAGVFCLPLAVPLSPFFVPFESVFPILDAVRLSAAPLSYRRITFACGSRIAFTFPRYFQPID